VDWIDSGGGKMMDYSEEISRRVRQLMKENNVSSKAVESSPIESSPIVLHQNDSGNSSWIFILLLILGISLFIIYTQRTNSSAVEKPTVYVQQEDYNKSNSNLNTRLDAHDKVIQTMAKRIWILSLVSNENVHSQGKPEKYLTIDENWKIDRMPETMSLTPEQKETLKDWTK
jgi:uncharacterized protein YeaC (DUF1315 family)